MNTLMLMIERKTSQLWYYVYQPWTAYQLGIILVLFFLAWRISKIAEPPIERRIRAAKINADLLRVSAALLRRLEWVFFIALAYLAKITIENVTLPSRSYVIAIALNLAVAWLLISVFSKIIRNRSLSKLVAFILIAIAGLSITGLLTSVMLGLDAVAFQLGDFRLSILSVLKGLILVSGALWLATTIGTFADSRLQKIDDLTPSLRVLLGKFVKIALVILALALSLSSIGIDLTALTVFSGAVGVGIGFGLQKVVSNFISGIIILLDKSIKPGDTITLGDTFGWIRELRARFVSVVTRDGKEYLIPNEDLITQQVVNWSFSDKLVRLDVPFGVSYNSDPHQVSKLAIAAVEEVERVTKRKSPVCWMTEFGDSSLNFVLRFWITDPQNGLTNIRGTVLLALWDVLKENNIEIPFPHREIIIKSGDDVSETDFKAISKKRTKSKSDG